MKTSAEIILKEISSDLTQFLKYGCLTSYTLKIDQNLNIDNIERLLRIHFVLTRSSDKERIGVIDFMEKLPERLRRIKTTVTNETELLECQVKGKINWGDTIKHRFKQDPTNKTMFVCDKREIRYDIAENLVLKYLLTIINDITYNDLQFAFEHKYDWLREWTSEKDLKNVLNQLFFRNVYLKRISTVQSGVTERMVNRASKSRIILYREAAELVNRYRRLMAFDLDDTEAKELLENTFIEPGKTDTLFELYWTIKIIKQFKNPRFFLIKPGTNIVACWENNMYRYEIYHDSTGSFQLKERLEELSRNLKNKDNFLGRELAVLKKIHEMTGIKSDGLWGGRPDILLQKYNGKGQLVSILIGEVKYTQDKGYAIIGLKELLEYISLIKENGKYVEDYKDLFGKLKKIEGCLFIDTIDENRLGIQQDSGMVHIVMFGDKTDNLSKILSKWDGIDHEGEFIK